MPTDVKELPKRIQRKRTKGWRKPENTVIVDRTSKWGNPFKTDSDAVKLLVAYAEKDGVAATPNEMARTMFREWLFHWPRGRPPGLDVFIDWPNLPDPLHINEIRAELRGKDIA